MSYNAAADVTDVTGGLKELQAQAKKKANQAKKVPIRRLSTCSGGVCCCGAKDYDRKTLVLFPNGEETLILLWHHPLLSCFPAVCESDCLVLSNDIIGVKSIGIFLQ